MKILLSILLLISMTRAQELNSVVTADIGAIPDSYREKLVNFVLNTEKYLNTKRFTERVIEGTPLINCSFNFLFTNVYEEDRYSAKVVIMSSREIYGTGELTQMLQISDNNWDFTYFEDMVIENNFLRADPLQKLLDYYAHILIAYELDSWERLGGSEEYRAALDIVNEAAGTGWGSQIILTEFDRRSFVELISGPDYLPFREAFRDYHLGLDIFNENKEEAYKNMVNIIYVINEMQLEQRRSFIIDMFFDTKRGEIMEYLKNYPDKEIFKVLAGIDPANITEYQRLYEQ